MMLRACDRRVRPLALALTLLMTAVSPVAADWPTNGLMVSNLYNLVGRSWLYADGTGDVSAVISFGPHPGAGANRFTASGTLAPGWTSPPAGFSDIDMSAWNFASDGAGGVLHAYHYFDGSSTMDAVYIERRNADRTATYPPGLVSDSHLDFPSVAADSSGGAYAAWWRGPGETHFLLRLVQGGESRVARVAITR